MKEAAISILAIALVVGAIFGVVFLAVRSQDRDKEACEHRGGVYFQARGGWLCLNPEALK